MTKLTDSGELLTGAELDYPWLTRTLRWNHRDPLTTHGSLSDVPEQLTAYYVMDCARAERAGELLDFHMTAVEVRPIHT